jgi:hypothetical protein
VEDVPEGGPAGMGGVIPFYNFYVMLKIGDKEWW